MRNNTVGFSMVELLVTLLVSSIMMTLVVGAFSFQSKVAIEQDRLASMESNLRAGMVVITEALRNAGYGVPISSLDTWINWVSGFTTQPVITSANAPQTLQVATCTSKPVATVNAASATGASQLTVSSTTSLTSGNVLWIGRFESARITAISGTTVTVDTDLSTSGNQGLSRAYPVGAPICRVDVLTFSINTTTNTLSMARSNAVNGTVTTQPLVDLISNLQISTVSAGAQYSVTLTGKTKNPSTNADLTRTLTSDVAVVN